MKRALVVQLARVGDLVQSLPAIEALKAGHPDCRFDLLCAAPLASLASLFPSISRALPWDGGQWRTLASASEQPLDRRLDDARQCVARLSDVRYDRAYVLNQHSRTVLAAHLVADHVTGSSSGGPLDAAPSFWAAYLRDVARDRGGNRVHLADVFCGMCDVRPLGRAVRIPVPPVPLPHEAGPVRSDQGLWVAVAVGAGDTERCIPVDKWRDWIDQLCTSSREARVILIGGRSERERAIAILEGLTPMTQARVWDVTGRTDLVQLAALLGRCDWVVGSDTGPLHLGAAMGTQALGFFFARARVHETGPYGAGHWVWQWEGERWAPRLWPIEESIGVLLGEGTDRGTSVQGWTLWESDVDEWGAYFRSVGEPASRRDSRETVWARCASGDGVDLLKRKPVTA